MGTVPRRRKTDQGLRYWLIENPYLDKLWLVVTNILVVVAVALAAGSSDDAKDFARLANETSTRTILLVGQADTLSRQIVDKARYQCQGLNQLREFQGEQVANQIKQTRTSLAKPGGLGTLESFRALIVKQQQQRQAQLDRLKRHTAEFPVRGHPYRVNCEAAHPLPPAVTVAPQP